MNKSASEWHQEAVALLEQDRTTEAVACLEALVVAHPDCQVAFNDLGVISFALGMKDEARKLLEKAVRLDPQQKKTLLNLSDVYLSLGLADRALVAMRQALALEPTDSELEGKVAALAKELGPSAAAPAPKLHISPSNVNYSDGSEAKMLEHFRRDDIDEYQCWDPKIGWSPYYNLSPIRKNLFNWMRLGGGSDGTGAGPTILELGAGCGAITSHLVTIPNARVVAVEGAIKRAEVTQMRCKHAENLEIHACNIEQFDTEERFDIVTSIGVMEYAGLYAPGAPEPFRGFLARVRRWLKPDGCLILAIENQLGHRYLAGMQEDHYHAAYQGINGYPDYNGTRTFDAARLRALLNEAGLPSQLWFYPFPDYKIPEVILSEEALADESFDHLALLDLPTLDVSTKDRPLFNERAFLKLMASYGSVGHLMNSFLILASASDDCPVLRDHRTTLACKLNVKRHRTFQHRVAFLRDKDGPISVERSLIHPGARPVGRIVRHGLEPAREAYRTGTRCLELAIRDAFESRNVAEAARLVSVWETTLKREARGSDPATERQFRAFVDRFIQRPIYSGPQAWWLGGDQLDLHPGNMLLGADGHVHIIDLEWQLDGALPVQLVFDYGLRKLLHTLAKSEAHFPKDLRVGARLRFPQALEALLPADSLYHSARLEEGDAYLSWFMSGVLSGDFTRCLPKPDPDSLLGQEVTRLVAQFAANPAEPGILEGLQRARGELATRLQGADANIDEWLASPAGKAWSTLRGSALPYEPLTRAEQEIADELHRRVQAEPKRTSLRAALMLYRPADQVVTPSFEDLAVPFLDPFIRYAFAAPPLFRQTGEVERFTTHFDEMLTWLLDGLRRCPSRAVVAKCSMLFAEIANLIPLYFSTQNTKLIYKKRAELIEMALERAGAALDFSWPTPRTREGRIRVGFLNQHLGPQTETYSSLPTFECLDRHTFEVVLLCPNRTNSRLEEYARERADRFVHVAGTLAAQVEIIRKLNLDILLIGTNVTAVSNNVALLAMHRLAPLQLITNSSPVTSGMRSCDGYITGTLSSLPAEQSHFCEKLLFLEGPAHCFDYSVDAQPAKESFRRKNLGIPQEAVVFVSGANFFKIIPELQHVWGRILAAVPGSRLVLHPFNPNWSSQYPVVSFVRVLDQVFSGYGIARDRWVVIANNLPSRSDAVEMLRLGDVYLDSYPFAGVNSTVDPLEIAMPCVCREADTFRSRMAGSLMRELGLPDLIADSEDAYVELAVRLATDPAFRGEMSRQIAQSMAQKPRFLDPEAYGAALGRLLQSLV